jgi:intein/homing endonuclease
MSAGEYLKKLIPYGALKPKVLTRILNQKGMGLIGVMIAAALVVIAALAVSNFIVDQSRLNKKLQVSGSCQNIANSLVEFIRKDESSIYISSYGAAPGSTNFPAGLDATEEGLDRFAFGGAMPVYTGTPPMSIPTTAATAMPAGFRYFNHLNIKNSINRLVALNFAGNYCCDSSFTNCGARYFDNDPNADGTIPAWEGFDISEKNVEVDLKVSFSANSAPIACTGGRLTLATMPSASDAAAAEFKVNVTLNRGTSEEKSCEASGAVQRSSDTTPSLTLIQYNRTNLCAGGSTGRPAQCGAAAPVTISVRTVKNSAGSACQTQCMKPAVVQTCNLNGANLFDTMTFGTCPADCMVSEPGTAYLCKIGEKNWFNSAATADFWEPCESATVKDWDGSPAGTVNISYVGGAGSQVTTDAIITLSNLTNNRAYVANVRAVDTAGNVGEAFCSAAGSDSCLASSPPHFTVINNVPTAGALTENALVGPVSKNVTGRDNTLTSLPKYSTALDKFVDHYQCQNGAPVFSSAITYTPAVPLGAYPPGTTCTATYTDPVGATVTLPSGTGVGFCECVSGPTGMSCNANLNNISAKGAYNIVVTAKNDCATLPAIPPQSWCLDNTPMAGAVYANTFSLTSAANFNAKVTEPPLAAKACGVTSLCPNLDGTFRTSTTGCNAPSDWASMVNSGCVQDPNSNYCLLMLDPCGRSQSTTRVPTPPAAVSYETTLDGVPYTSAPASNQCFEFPLGSGTNVGGNDCDAGSYCSINGKCFTSCPKAGAACTVAADCEDPSYGKTSAQAGGPQCVGNRCTCPTNSNSQAAALCAKKYCPILNSCNFAMTPTAPVGGICKGCVQWSVGAWSACSAGNRTRPVSCPVGQCCVGPAPSNSQTCPDCSLPWGGSIVNGTSVTAYLNSSEPCTGTCVSETRICTNGILSGSYTKPACALSCASGCTAIPYQETSCFVAGTQIELPNGEHKSIEKVKVGENVVIIDEESGERKISPVEEILHHEAKLQPMYKFTFDNGAEFTVTAEHLIYVDGGSYLPAMDLYKNWKNKITNLLLDKNSNLVKIKNIITYEDNVPTYNLHVKGISSGRGHNYFANGILAHNNKCCYNDATGVCTAMPNNHIRILGTGVDCSPSDIIQRQNDPLCDTTSTTDACSFDTGSPSCAAAPPPPSGCTDMCLACFIGGTQVTLADGKTKNIEDVIVGEKIQTYDESKKAITVSPVEEVFHHEEKLDELYTFEFSNDSKVTSNDVHLFYSVKDQNYFSAKSLYTRWARGENILVLSDKKDVLEVKNIEQSHKKVKLYNLHVISPYNKDSPMNRVGHNYFANGVLVHNAKDSSSCSQGGMVDNGSGNSCGEPIDPLNVPAQCCAHFGGEVQDAGGGGGSGGNCYVGCFGACGLDQCEGVCGPANGTSPAAHPSTYAEMCTVGTPNPKPSSLTGSAPWKWTCDVAYHGAVIGTMGGTYKGGNTPCSTVAGAPTCSYIELVKSVCFVAGTPVTLFDGTTKAIDKIEVGDKVLIYDEVTGKNKVSPVNEVLHHEPQLQPMYQFIFENGFSFTVTGQHLIYTTNEGYTSAMELYSNWRNNKTNTVLDQSKNPTRIKHITVYNDSVPTYNIHVDGIKDVNNKYGRNGRGHNYYANGILAHNNKVCDDGHIDAQPYDLTGTKMWCPASNIVTAQNNDCLDGGPYQECTNPTGCTQYAACGWANGGTGYATLTGNDKCGLGAPINVTDTGTGWTWSCQCAGVDIDPGPKVECLGVNNTVSCSASK